MDFYDEVLRELITALGAALFVANAFALLRRRSDARRAAKRAAARTPGNAQRVTVARTRSAGPGRGNGRDAPESQDLAQAPLARTVTYLLIGFVVMVWGIASMTS
jgi:hypothetical protein